MNLFLRAVDDSAPVVAGSGTGEVVRPLLHGNEATWMRSSVLSLEEGDLGASSAR